MPLTGIRGKGGSGKNTYIAYHLIKNKKLLLLDKYTNFELDLPNTTKCDSLELFEIEEDGNPIISIWDEGYTEMDNRNSMDLMNRINSLLLFQARKNNMSMVAITQLNVMDLRWRELEEKTIICLDRPIYDKKLKPYKGDFKYVFCEQYRKPVKFVLPYFIAKKVFKFFKNKEKIFPRDFEELKTRINLRNPKNRKELINKIVKEIIDTYPDLDNKTVTKIWLKNEMLDLDIPIENLGLSDYVYVRLKARLK